MGTYDTICANIKCPLCGTIQTVYFQTKDLEGDLTELCEGDTTVYFDEFDKDHENGEYHFGLYGFIYPSEEEFCLNCKKHLELFAITRDNRIIRVLDGRILSRETIFKPSVKYKKLII